MPKTNIKLILLLTSYFRIGCLKADPPKEAKGKYCKTKTNKKLVDFMKINLVDFFKFIENRILSEANL